jgi:hypothetical protein
VLTLGFVRSGGKHRRACGECVRIARDVHALPPARGSGGDAAGTRRHAKGLGEELQHGVVGTTAIRRCGHFDREPGVARGIADQAADVGTAGLRRRLDREIDAARAAGNGRQ